MFVYQADRILLRPKDAERSSNISQEVELSSGHYN